MQDPDISAINSASFLFLFFIFFTTHQSHITIMHVTPLIFFASEPKQQYNVPVDLKDKPLFGLQQSPVWCYSQSTLRM